MSDIVRIYDINKNKQQGFYSRNNIPDNYFYFAINVWIVFKKNKIMIQKRSSLKKVYPNKYECVAGGVIEDESLVDACIREIKEEIGLDVDKKHLHFLHEFLDKTHKYFMFTYVAILNESEIENIKLDLKEVSRYEIVDINQIIEMVNNNLFADSFKLRFPLYLDLLKEIIFKKY